MYLSLDLGSTFVKAGVYTQALEPAGEGAGRVAYLDTPEERVEFSAEAFDAALEAAVGEALRSSGVGGAEVSACAVTSQAQTFCILDGEGRPASPFYSWQDARTASGIAAMDGDGPFSEFARHSSFGVLYPGLAVCILHHLRTSEDLRLSDDSAVCFLPTYVYRDLCGADVIDDNLAAMSGLYSLVGGGWNEEYLKVCGLEEGTLPGILGVGEVVGVTQQETPWLGLLPRGLGVVAAGNDQTAGAYGARLHENNRLLVGLGTAQIAYRCFPSLPPPDDRFVRGSYPGGLYYRMVADSCGGNVVVWSWPYINHDRPGGMKGFDEFFAAALAGREGRVRFSFDPDTHRMGWTDGSAEYGSGKEAPKEIQDADLARAVMAFLCDRMAGFVHDLDPEGTLDVVCAGGGSKRALWVDMLRNRIGRGVDTTEADALLGAAAMAADATGSPYPA